MNTWHRIILHCSDSTWGSAAEIRKWHVEGNGWADIGYQYVILNGQVKPDYYLACCNGSVEIGRTIDGDRNVETGESGAHAYGYNGTSLGVCLIGKEEFTSEQLGATLNLVRDLQQKFEIDTDDVIGHYEINAAKSCPNVDMVYLRGILKKVK